MKILFTLSIITLLASCQSNEEKKEPQKAKVESNAEIEHEHLPDELQLNNGAKWKVDDSMMVHLRNMSSSLLTFRLTEHTNHKLADSILANIDLLTSNCTMKGAAHDELHKWLIPFIDLANDFAEVKTENEAAEIYKEIVKSFDTFHQFFE